MQASSRRVPPEARRIIFGSVFVLFLLLAFCPQETARAGTASLFDEDPILLDSPRPAPYPLGFDSTNEFRRSLVQLSDGGLKLEFLDLCLPSRSEPLIIKRLYRSGLQTEGVFGKGWASNLDMRLTLAAAGSPRIVESDGRTTGYEPDSAGHFTAINGTLPGSELLHANGQWVRIWESGAHEIFDEQGRLLQRVHGEDSLTLSYDSAQPGLPASIRDSANHVLLLRYRDGLLIEAAYPDHRTIRYDYDGRSLSEVTDAIGRRTALAYDDGRMTRLELPLETVMEFRYAPGGNLREVAGPGGLTTAFEWSFDPKSVTISLTASSAGINQTVDIRPEAVDVAQWGIPGRTPRPSLAIVHGLSAGRVLSAHLLGEKILFEGPDGRAVLDPGMVDKAETSETSADIDPHEWRLRFTPAMARSRESGTTYDEAGRPVAVVTDEGARESWNWDEADRIVQWTDAEGTISHYEYDALDRPVRVTAGDEAIASAEYNAQGLLSRLVNADGDVGYDYDGAGNLSRIVIKGGGVIDLRRDEAGRPVGIEIDGKPSMNVAYDDAGRLVNLAAPDDKGFSYKYDSQGNLQELTDPDGATTSYRLVGDRKRVEITAANGDKSAFTFDRTGSVIEAKAPGTPDYRFKYAKDGQLESASTSDGRARHFEYDSEGRLIHESGEQGTSLRFAYDDKGRLEAYAADDARASFRYGEDGRLSITTEKDGLKERLDYDSEGRLLKSVDSAGAQWRFSRDARGTLQTTGPAGDTLTRELEEDGRVVVIRHEFGSKSAERRYRYDESGRAAQAIYEDGTSAQYTYDSAGNLAGLRDRLGNDHAYRFTGSGRLAAIEGPLGTERWLYDSRDRLIAHEDPTEAATRFEYPEDGKSIVTIDPEGGRTRVTVNAAGQTERIEDAAGGIIGREFDPSGRLSGFIDPNGRKTAWSYDEGARVTERRMPSGKIYRQRYDENGNLVETSSPGNRTVKRRYDAQGELSGIATSDGESWTFSHDGFGELEGVKGSSGEATYERDALGRVTAYTDGAGKSVGAAYEAAGRLEKIVAPDGDEVSYAYNSLGQLSAATTRAGDITYAYDKAGRLAEIDYPNGMRTSYRYLSGLRIGSITTTANAGGLLLEESYEYDRRGNVTAIARKGKTTDGAKAASAAFLGRSEFEYDALNRIVSARFPDGASEYFAFDPAGNLTKQVTQSTAGDGGKSIGAESLRYDADQALVGIDDRVHRPSPDGSLCGEDTGIPCAGGYDAFNRLRKWRDQSYSYDGEGRLADWRDGHGNGGHFVYLEGQVVAETGIGNRADRNYIASPGDPLWAAVRTGGHDYYPIRSANGSLLAVTDEAGSIARLCSYYTFRTGPAWAAADGAPQCEYAGGRELGPGVWFGTRVFSGTGARFLSRDTEGPDKDGNFYAYALANPLRFVDRTGANSTPAYHQILGQLGMEPSTDAVRDELIRQFTGEAITNPDPIARQQARALATVLKTDPVTGASTVPLKLSDLPSSAGGGYDPVTRRTTINIEAIAQRSTPENYFEGLKGVVRHEVEGHGLRKDTMLWTENPSAPIMEKWAKAGVEPIYGVTSPYSQLEEVGAFAVQQRANPTLVGMYPEGETASQQEAIEWIVDRIHGKSEIIEMEDEAGRTELVEIFSTEPPASYSPERIKRMNDETKRLIGEDEFFEHTIRPPKKLADGTYPPNNRPFTDKVNALKQFRLEQAAESAGRIPVSAAGKAGAVEGTVSRAVAREATLLEKASAKAAAIARKVGNALSSLKSKALAAWGKAGSVAKRAFSFIARKFGVVGRVAKYLVPAAGQVLAVKDAIDTAIGIGKMAGELAADLYIKYRQGRDAILNSFDKLIKDMEALDDKNDPKQKKKKKRQSELLASQSPEPAQIGMRPGSVPQAEGQPPANASASNQPEAQANTTQASNEPAKDQQPQQSLGPTTPLGGKNNQPEQKPKPEAPVPPKPDAPKPPEAEAKPAEPQSKGQGENQPPPGTKETSGKPVKEWEALCGSTPEAVLSGPPALVGPCLCFYWLKKHVPSLSPESFVDPPAEFNACGAYIKAMAGSEPKTVAESQPAKPQTEPAPQAKPEPAQETAEAQPDEAPPEATPEPQESAKGPDDTLPPIENGLPPPEVPDFMKPRPAQQAQPEPEPAPAPQAKPAPPVYEPERPSSRELEKPNLYDNRPKVTARDMTPRESTTPQSNSGAAGGGGLAGAYKWAAGWLGYVSGKIN